MALHGLQFFLCFRCQLIFQAVVVLTGMCLNTHTVVLGLLRHPGLRRLLCFAFYGLSPILAVPVGIAPAGAAANCSDEAVAVLAWTVRCACFPLLPGLYCVLRLRVPMAATWIIYNAPLQLHLRRFNAVHDSHTLHAVPFFLPFV